MDLKYTCARGTRDIIYPETQLWEKVLCSCREIFKLYNYKEIKTPVFEGTELFTRSIGEETDIVNKEMYVFADKKGRSLALRPEGTASVVRAYLEDKLYTEPLTKLWYAGPMFRYERKQAGRQRQFDQIGIEVFGSPDPRIDVEAIEILFALYKKLEIKDVYLSLNSIGCDACRPVYKENLKTFLNSIKSELCEDCKIRTEKNPLRVLDCKNPSCQKFFTTIPNIPDFICPDCKTHFDQVKKHLEAVGIEYEINPRLVRGLDYYTRTVFEAISRSSALGAQNTLCGGGRYDNLVAQYGGNPTPAFGWAFGLERLIMIMQEEQENIPESIEYFIATMGDEARNKGFELLSSLRKMNKTAETYYFKEDSLKKQLKWANKLGALNVIIIGEDELNQGRFVLRDMGTGEQQSMPFSTLDEL